MLIALGVVAALLVLGFLYEQISRSRDQRLPLPGRLVDVGGYRLHLTDEGQGGPAVVVIHGAGDCSYSWTYVRKAVAPFTRILSYDRPGLGSSPAGPNLDPVRTIEELHTLLERSGAPGPYVLVGHSLGGLIARLYALKYPDEVAGMVLVDSTHEFLVDDAKFKQGFSVVQAVASFNRALSTFGIPRFLGALGVMPLYPERKYYAQQLSREEYRQWVASVNRNNVSPAVGAEALGLFAILAEAKRQMADPALGPQFGDLPLAVLTNPGFGDGWAEMHRELAKRSTNSIHRISDRPGHSIQMVRPELVIDAIRHVVNQVRARTAHVS
jgi:pimeloyl-ACP methyl ester carboxylesterase